MTGDLDFGALRDKVAVALHNADCGDRRCSGSALSAYYRQADVALEAIAEELDGGPFTPMYKGDPRGGAQ